MAKRNGATGAPVRRPAPDFHERASFIGDVSPLLRRLGLVIDLRVDDLSLLANAVQVQAVVTVPGLDNQVKTQPATTCDVDGTEFFARSASGDYVGPALRIGDEERYRILDLDPVEGFHLGAARERFAPFLRKAGQEEDGEKDSHGTAPCKPRTDPWPGREPGKRPTRALP